MADGTFEPWDKIPTPAADASVLSVTTQQQQGGGKSTKQNAKGQNAKGQNAKGKFPIGYAQTVSSDVAREVALLQDLPLYSIGTQQTIPSAPPQRVTVPTPAPVTEAAATEAAAVPPVPEYKLLQIQHEVGARLLPAGDVAADIIALQKKIGRQLRRRDAQIAADASLSAQIPYDAEPLPLPEAAETSKTKPVPPAPVQEPAAATEIGADPDASVQEETLHEPKQKSQPDPQAEPEPEPDVQQVSNKNPRPQRQIEDGKHFSPEVAAAMFKIFKRHYPHIEENTHFFHNQDGIHIHVSATPDLAKDQPRIVATNDHITTHGEPDHISALTQISAAYVAWADERHVLRIELGSGRSATGAHLPPSKEFLLHAREAAMHFIFENRSQHPGVNIILNGENMAEALQKREMARTAQQAAEQREGFSVRPIFGELSQGLNQGIAAAPQVK